MMKTPGLCWNDSKDTGSNKMKTIVFTPNHSFVRVNASAKKDKEPWFYQSSWNYFITKSPLIFKLRFLLQMHLAGQEIKFISYRINFKQLIQVFSCDSIRYYVKAE